jgi:HAD superfamily hydrolase (TIGR01509 family)
MEKFKNIKAVLFDLDGTLVKLPINYKKLRSELKKLFLSYGIKSNFKPILTSIERACSRKNKRAKILEETAYKIIEKYELEGAKKVKVISGAKTVLKKLKSNGLKLVVVSRNSHSSILLALKKVGLISYIDLIISRDDVRRVKPDPEMIKKVLKYFRLRPVNVIVVGDHVYDIIAARRMGVVSVGIKTPESDFSRCYPDFVVSDIKKILKFI